ncbi:hypothetical protein ACMFMG_000367 [Clarireedia jacksonii]
MLSEAIGRYSRMERFFIGIYISENNIIITELPAKDAPKGGLIIVEFAPKFENLKPLARELRHVLFPIRDGEILTGTFHDHDIMYDTAIGRLGKEEQAIA